MANLDVVINAKTSGDAWQSKADKNNVYTKTESDNKYQAKTSKQWVKVGTFDKPNLDGGTISAQLQYATKPNTRYYITYTWQPYHNPMTDIYDIRELHFTQIKQSGYTWSQLYWNRNSLTSPVYLITYNIGTELDHLYCSTGSLDLEQQLQDGTSIIYALDLFEEQDVTTNT